MELTPPAVLIPADAPAPPPRPLAVAGNLLLATLAFVAATLAVRQARPPGIHHAFHERRAALDRVAAEVTVLVIGSSRVKHHIAPRVVDRVTNEAGLPTVTFNYGVPAANVFEIERELRHVLTRDLPRLQLIVLEADTRPPAILFGTARSRDLSTPDVFTDAVLLTLDAHERDVAADLQTLVRQTVHNTLSAGRLASTISRRPPRPEPPVPGGFEVRARVERPTVPVPPDMPAEVARLRRGQPPRNLVAPYVRHYLRMRQACLDAGIRPVLLVGPDHLGGPRTSIAFEQALLARGMDVIRLDVETLPTIYRPEHWSDGVHLSGSGAAIFGAVFGRRLVPILRRARETSERR